MEYNLPAETRFDLTGSIPSATTRPTDSLSEWKLAPKLVVVRDNSREYFMLQQIGSQ